MANVPLKSLVFPGLGDKYLVNGITPDMKAALLQLASKVAYVDEHGQDYYDALYDAFYPRDVEFITAVYTQSGTVYDTDDLDSLKTDLVVTATYVDGTSETVTAYTLYGTLTAGTNTITVSYGGKTTTFNVIVKGRTNLSTAPISWNTASGGLVVISGSNVKIGGNGSGYPNAVLTNLLYQLSQAANKQVHIIGDVVVSGLTSGAYQVVSRLFPNQTPNTMGQRVEPSGGVFAPNVLFSTNGSYHFDSVFVPGTDSRWEGKSGYIGIVLFGSAPNNGASASFSNLAIYWEDV